jgi:23S rRNA (pseudouridine1915-N3)-methyltransferase
MKNLIIRAIGRLPETWQKEAVHSYMERLSSLGGAEVIELPEASKGSAKPDEVRTRAAEAVSLLKGIPEGAFVVALDETGKAFSSPELAKRLAGWSEQGQPVVFLIGGSWGLDASVRERANAVLAFGPMTLPHGLARVVLLEQLYRARMIQEGRAYQK